MFLERDQIQYFEEVGYEYLVASHCPLTTKYASKCTCDVDKSFGEALLLGERCELTL